MAQELKDDIYKYRTHQYLSDIPNEDELVMCRLNGKNDHGFVFNLVDYQNKKASLFFRDVTNRSKKMKFINKVFTSKEKLYPIMVSSIEDDNIYLTNLNIDEKVKEEFEKNYLNYSQIFGIFHQYFSEKFIKEEIDTKDEQTLVNSQRDFLEKYKKDLDKFMNQTLWKIKFEEVQQFCQKFKNKWQEDTVFELDKKDKKILAEKIKKYIRNPVYEINYYFELTTIDYKGYHRIKEIFETVLMNHKNEIDQLDPYIDIMQRNPISINEKTGNAIQSGNHQATTYSLHGKSKNLEKLKELFNIIIDEIRKIKSGYESYKPFQITTINQETKEVNITKLS